MTTTTYQAITDPTIKTWHLGAAQRKNKAFCGTVLIWPADTRKVAVKVPRDERHHETSDDLTKVTCGACKRNREWKYATGVETRPAPPTPRAGRPSPAARQEPTVTAAAAQAPQDSAAQPDPAEQVDGSQPRARARKRGQSRADKAAARTAADRERREAAQAAATAALDNIDAALNGAE